MTHITESTTIRTIDRNRQIYKRIMDTLIKGKKLSPELASKAKHYTKGALSPAHGFAKIREDYINGDIFKLGDIVECSDGIGEIVNRGPNYVTVMIENKEYRKWLKDVHPSLENSPVTENFRFKGFTPQNFTDRDFSLFSGLLEHKDSYAVLNCIKAYDSLLGMDNIAENFNQYKVDFDRAVKYFTKLEIDHSLLDESEDTLLTYAILNGISNFNVLNEAKVNNIAQEIDYHIRDMVKSGIGNTTRLRKIQVSCSKNPVGKSCFERHLKTLSPEAYNELIRGNQ